MTEPMETELIAALRKERSARAPEASRARVAGRLASMLPGVAGVAGANPTGGAHTAATTPGAAGASAASAGLSGTRALVAMAFVLGGAAGAGLHATLAPTPAPRVVYVDRPAAALAPASAIAPAPAPAIAPALAPAPALALAPAIPASPPPASAPSAQMDAERALLDNARGALAQGDPSRAVADLLHHERNYPKPILGEERDALMVQALVVAGRYDEARARAEAFRKKTPTSLFTGAVEAALRTIP